MTPEALDALLLAVARGEQRLTELPDSAPLRRRFVQRTRLLRFPDLIDVHVLPASAGATLALYSRSLLGRRDFGVNRARLWRWLAAMNAA